MHLGRHPGHLPRKNFSRVSGELCENIRVKVCNLLDLEIEPLPRHPLIRLPESNPALLGLGLTHDQALAKFAMKRSTL